MSTPSDQPVAPRPAPGRPKDLAKRAAILDAAQRMFLEHGFEGVSMDQIAALAGVSKLTAYSHFGDKDTLFAAAVESYCEQQVPPSLFTPSPGTPLRPRMFGMARAAHAPMTSPDPRPGLRLARRPARVDPRLSRMFWDAGAGHLQAGFAALLARRTATGELDVADTGRAASQFFALLRGELHPRLMMGCGDMPGFDVDAHLEATV